jgi:hypothetical protein
MQQAVGPLPASGIVLQLKLVLEVVPEDSRRMIDAITPTAAHGGEI